MNRTTVHAVLFYALFLILNNKHLLQRRPLLNLLYIPVQGSAEIAGRKHLCFAAYGQKLAGILGSK